MNFNSSRSNRTCVCMHVFSRTLDYNTCDDNGHDKGRLSLWLALRKQAAMLIRLCDKGLRLASVEPYLSFYFFIRIQPAESEHHLLSRQEQQLILMNSSSLPPSKVKNRKALQGIQLKSKMGSCETDTLLVNTSVLLYVWIPHLSQLWGSLLAASQ